jgi:hypothetical protein
MNQDSGVSTIERAFQLARAGACRSVADIRQQLTNERYDNVHSHLIGARVQQQLRDALAARGVASRVSGDDEDDA